ncbi:DUF3224 domain-containing protein [Dyadobacter tibetensis]|uniref:DUF3224 domain-containing protein n=1 Tax=Dyadobacter tibetensis TaxID=1211851 RepID=UPI000470F6B1|nr:DUF3224 domain-containing protein [Dyadobacter tibetensis]
MTFEAEARYTITDGYEESFSKNELGQKLTTGKFTISYRGDLEGEGHLMELKNHVSDEYISVYGLERFTGAVNGQKGSFVLEYTGHYQHGRLKSTRKIVANSGEGDLKFISGFINFDFNNAKNMVLRLAYNLPENHVAESTFPH